MNTLNEIGFNRNIPFEIAMQESTYSNTDKIETEIQLADSGYGQGQILVNPLHLASIYTSFLNEGNMVKPYLTYEEEAAGEIWIENAFTKENVDRPILLISMVENVKGIGGSGYVVRKDATVLDEYFKE